MPADNKNKTTILKLRRQKAEGKTTVAVTAYQSWQARIAENAGVDIILVGDSAAMTEHGMKDTLSMSMETMIDHCRSVARGATLPFLIGDMPYMSYQLSDSQAVENAGRFISSGMDAVKVEGGMTDRIAAISEAGIIVCSHLGLTPQTRAKLGGYRVQGKTSDDAKRMLDKALAMQDAGCDLLLLEAMPVEPAAMIASELKIPVYGIGAGDGVDGQLVIFHDLLGLFDKFKSKFVKRYLNGERLFTAALTDYCNEVRDGEFPSEENFYAIKDDELEKLLGDKKWKYTEKEENANNLGGK
jgi:3-methyl-2-oxobutanoate hydroxymethyltransferase